MNRPVDDLVRVVAAGGGITVASAARSTADLVKISAAGGGRARIRVVMTRNLTTEEMIEVAAAGRGSVEFLEGDQQR